MRAMSLDPAVYRPSAPEPHAWRIGLLGCGNIARNAHLRAYTSFGYEVAAGCDLEESNLELVRQQYGVPWTTTDVDVFLARDDIDIIDLAVHGAQRLAVMERICAARPPQLKAILSQKPLAMCYADAARIVELAESHGLVFMVNQQARWAPEHRAAKQVIDEGMLGHVYSIVHFQRQTQDFPNHWFTKLPNANIVDHGIHYLDLIRHFADADPVRVKAIATMVPGQNAVTPMCHTIGLDFTPDRHLSAVSHFNNIVTTPELYGYDWYLDGTEGSLKFSHTKLTVSLKDSPRDSRTVTIQGSWFPEAFGGSMGELQAALNEDRPPLTNGRDNLKSIRLAEAAVESAKNGTVIAL